LDRKRLARLFYGTGQMAYPWATECPVKFDVWFELARRERGGAEKRADLILSVHEDHGVRRVLDVLRENGLFTTAQPIAAGSFVAARLTLAELVRVILPMTSMAGLISTSQRHRQRLPDLVGSLADDSGVEMGFRDEERSARSAETSEQLWWFLRLLRAVVQAARSATTADTVPANLVPVPYAVAGLLHNAVVPPDRRRFKETAATLDRRREYPITAVTMNRQAAAAVSRSRATVKADAAEQLFSVDCSSIGWAVVDSGIDVNHPAFSNWAEDEGAWYSEESRVVRTFDLVDARKALADNSGTGVIDWTRALPDVEMLLRDNGERASSQAPQRAYKEPADRHGTHVAGVLGGFWPEYGLKGVCPNIRLYDFRVLNHRGIGNEFAVIAALQAIRHINEEAGKLVIAGANLSLAVPHDVTADACGWTPVCIEVERLVRSGVVVVAAAGNSGFVGATQTLGADYRGISISDPGNADAVITVGSTHRSNPHRHGVSYFSGRGPTADGRPKPDLLAPGEDIDGPVPDRGIAAMHGTSQAAAHVSGAAAMLIARHRELLGRPERVKQVLCATATDLGRERAFQGHGLVDVLRAMQSI
jgi:hypothetical protein